MWFFFLLLKLSPLAPSRDSYHSNSRSNKYGTVSSGAVGRRTIKVILLSSSQQHWKNLIKQITDNELHQSTDILLFKTGAAGHPSSKMKWASDQWGLILWLVVLTEDRCVHHLWCDWTCFSLQEEDTQRHVGVLHTALNTTSAVHSKICEICFIYSSINSFYTLLVLSLRCLCSDHRQHRMMKPKHLLAGCSTAHNPCPPPYEPEQWIKIE